MQEQTLWAAFNNFTLFCLFVLVLGPLPEENASDLCCLLSSLVQVMMDPHCRTRVGFQSLVQKEWIMGGHCFLDRCNHLRQSDKEEVSVLLADLLFTTCLQVEGYCLQSRC